MISKKRLINSFLEMYNSIMFKKIGIIYKESLSFVEDISPHMETILSHSKELYFHKSATDAPKDFPQLSKNELGDPCKSVNSRGCNHKLMPSFIMLSSVVFEH